jgi:hypothetical protein
MGTREQTANKHGVYTVKPVEWALAGCLNSSGRGVWMLKLGVFSSPHRDGPLAIPDSVEKKLGRVGFSPRGTSTLPRA